MPNTRRSVQRNQHCQHLCKLMSKLEGIFWSCGIKSQIKVCLMGCVMRQRWVDVRWCLQCINVTMIHQDMRHLDMQSRTKTCPQTPVLSNIQWQKFYKMAKLLEVGQKTIINCPCEWFYKIRAFAKEARLESGIICMSRCMTTPFENLPPPSSSVVWIWSRGHLHSAFSVPSTAVATLNSVFPRWAPCW